MVFKVGTAWKQFHRDYIFAFGVSFGGNSPYNNGHLSEAPDSIGFPYTFAVLEGLLDGFDQIEEIAKRHKSITDIKILTQDPWLVGAFAWGRDLHDSAHMYHEKPGNVQPLLLSVDAVKERLNKLEQRVLSIEFWLVDETRDALNQANKVLDSEFGPDS